MGKAQKKTGKGRLDKYYKLAKEQGYRARSAFKLIQLNKKFAFLENARCCIDLCAAPGGWLQVASKYMPVNSVIIGVDLNPIKPIPRVVTFTADITTPQCRSMIRSELKDWKADVVLHDGAPNVGTAWVQDAFSQSELVLMSLKLAVEFLIQGGTFVTKVFRSADYNNLVWVFNQLFGKVEATKPPSSRNVSAEIFVVCRDFLAPKHIDPKFLDPKHVFKDLAASAPSGIDKSTSANNAKANVFDPHKKRRKRDGYDEGDYTLFKKGSASEFVRTKDPIEILGTVNTLAFVTDEEKEWLNSDITTPEIKANCDDLKVLGRGDFKALLKWRNALREEIGLDVKAKPTAEFTEQVEVTEEADEDQQLQEELERLKAEAAALTKRQRRKANEVKAKMVQRMQLHMAAPVDIGLEQVDLALDNGQEEIFDLEDAERKFDKRGGLSALTADDVDALSGEEDASEDSSVEDDDSQLLGDDEEKEKKLSGLEAELEGLYNAYQERLRERDAKYRIKEARKNNPGREEWQGISTKDASDSEDEDSEEEGGWELTQKMKDDAGENSSSDESSSSETNRGMDRKRKRTVEIPSAAKRARLVTKLDDKAPSSSRGTQMWFSQDIFTGIESGDGEDLDAGSITDDSGSGAVADEGQDPGDDTWTDHEIQTVPQDTDDTDMWDVANEDKDEVKQATIAKHGLNTPEAVTLAMQLVNREKTKTQLINDGFNRYSLNSKEGLPAWFLDDESKAYKPNIPVTKEAIATLRAKQRALDARPIKKIAEAKARKKHQAAQRLEKALKKAEGVNATKDMTEREKAQQIEKVMRKGMSKGKKAKGEVKVVVAKGAHKGIKGRPKGVKGRYTMVDSRMKKEVRAKKRRDKATKRRKRA